MPAARKVLSSSTAPTMSIAKAKANFSSLITSVEKKHGAVTILRRGVPVAKVVPINDDPVSLYGCMRGTVRELGDIIGPTGVEWALDGERAGGE